MRKILRGDNAVTNNEKFIKECIVGTKIRKVLNNAEYDVVVRGKIT